MYCIYIVGRILGFSVLLTSPNPQFRFRNEDAKGIGHTVTCELKTGEMYRGHLMNCEAGITPWLGQPGKLQICWELSGQKLNPGCFHGIRNMDETCETIETQSVEVVVETLSERHLN